MYETTQVTYGEGTITVTMSSESATEVAAPNIRFGSYESAARACFTAKELEDISGGENAEVSFSFLMSDELMDTEKLPLFEDTIEKESAQLGALHQGVFFNVDASKSVGSDEPEALGSFYDDVEMQYDIPLFLVTGDREYFIITEEMGACNLEQDIDVDADTLTVSTHDIGTTLLLYQTENESLVQTKEKLHIKSQHLFVTGIVVLILAWFLMDRRYRKIRD